MHCLFSAVDGICEENNEMLGLERRDAAETWTLTLTDRRRLEAFEMWI